MNNEEKILSILEAMQTDIVELKTGQAKLEAEVMSISGTVARIELEHGSKLDALFDGYQQLNGKVTRIEEHVSSQDDMILKRVFPKAME